MSYNLRSHVENEFGGFTLLFLFWMIALMSAGILWGFIGFIGGEITKPSHKPLKPETFYVSILEKNSKGYLAERIGKEQWVLLEMSDDTLGKGYKLKVVAQKHKDETYTAELGTKYDSKVPVYEVNLAEPAKVEKDDK